LPAAIGIADEVSLLRRRFRAPFEDSYASRWVAERREARGLAAPDVPRLAEIRRALLGWLDGTRGLAQVEWNLAAEFGPEAKAAIGPILADLEALGLVEKVEVPANR
jgi:hypothetical protein